MFNLSYSSIDSLLLTSFLFFQYIPMHRIARNTKFNIKLAWFNVNVYGKNLNLVLHLIHLTSSHLNEEKNPCKTESALFHSPFSSWRQILGVCNEEFKVQKKHNLNKTSSMKCVEKWNIKHKKKHEKNPVAFLMLMALSIIPEDRITNKKNLILIGAPLSLKFEYYHIKVPKIEYWLYPW